MNFVSRMTAGRGRVSRSERTTRSVSASTISALPSMTRRSARRIGTIVSGSYDAFNARQPSTIPQARGVSRGRQDTAVIPALNNSHQFAAGSEPFGQTLAQFPHSFYQVWTRRDELSVTY